jgi:mRNA-degrading endonuclease HigB of HigAB toxin-antitoxin module
VDNLERIKPIVFLKIIGIFKLTQQIDRTPWLDQNIKVWFQDISNTKWRKIDDIKKLYANVTVLDNLILFPIKDYQIVTKFNDETCQLLILDVIRQEELVMYSLEKSELGLIGWLKSLSFKKEKYSYLAYERKLKRLGSIFLFSANSKEGIEARSLISQISMYDAQKSQIDKPNFIEGLKIRALLK